MTPDNVDGKHGPKRFQCLRCNRLRDVLPVVLVFVGALVAIRADVGLGGGGDAFFVYAGSGLSCVGVLVFIMNRWQARCGF